MNGMKKKRMMKDDVEKEDDSESRSMKEENTNISGLQRCASL